MIAPPRSAVGSEVVLGLPRNAAGAESATGLALSFSPLPPQEPTATLERPVAIKRIASAITRDAALLPPFLEAARAVTAIRHPNVARIDEVGVDGDEVFLVTDYLLGETAASLTRKLHSQGERLAPILAAHIVAAACAGLEAGHSAGILHSHLTPQDIFIGYDGVVRVLDIGIAAALNELSGDRDGAGIEYASPERCKNATLDRRSDVFSLGTILWELTTGLSPFEREKSEDTIRAICEEAIVPSKNVVPGLPAQLSTITMQALSRDRADRPQTAKALGVLLGDLVKKLAADGAPAEEQLRRLMARHFEARAKDKREMLRRVDARLPLDGLDIGALDRTAVKLAPKTAPQLPKPPIPRVSPPPTKAESVKTTSVPPAASNPPPDIKDQPSIIIAPTVAPPLPVGAMVPSAPPAPLEYPPPVPAFRALDEVPLPLEEARSTSRLVIAAAVAAVVIIAVVGVSLAFRRKNVETAASVDVRPSASVTPRDHHPVAPRLATSESVVPPAASSVAETREASETVVHIDTVPQHASIYIDGAKKGVSPLDLRLPKSDEAVVIELRHTGYTNLKERIVPDVNQRLKLTLSGTRGPSAPPTASGPYHKFE